MKKTLTILSISSLITACGSSKDKAGSSSIKNAVNQLTKNDKLNPVFYMSSQDPKLNNTYSNKIWTGVNKYWQSPSNYYVIANTANKTNYIEEYKKALNKAQILVISGNKHTSPLSNFYNDVAKDQGIIYLDGKVPDAHNINSIVFKVEQAAFYAGYLAAKYLSDNRKEYDTQNSKGLKIGTFGSENTPSVTDFMGGFRRGIEFWNLNDGEMVGERRIDFIKLGSSQDDYFSGNSSPGGGKTLSEELVRKGADIILPVAGPQILDTLQVIKQRKANTKVIGINVDQALQYPEYKGMFFTSIIKKTDIATYNAIRHIFNDEKNDEYGLGKVTIGSLENDLVSIATSEDNLVSSASYKMAQDDLYISDAAINAKRKFKP